MTIAITVSGSTMTANLLHDSLNIEQNVADRVMTADFILKDVSKAIAFTARGEVHITDDGSTMFHGTLGGWETDPIILHSTCARRFTLHCQDDSFELERRVIEGATFASGSTSDLDRVTTLFDAYYSSGIDYSTYVTGTPLIAQMEEQAFAGISLRQGLSEICSQSGGMFYVHHDAGSTFFHYFDPDTGESNTAAWSLSDDPAKISGSVHGFLAISESVDAYSLANAFYVAGQDGVAEWMEDDTSIAAYGRSEAPVANYALLTIAAASAAGSALLGRYANPNTVYRVTTDYGAGLRAGMEIAFESVLLGVDATHEIRRVRIYTVNGSPRYDLDLGGVMRSFVGGGRTIQDAVSHIDSTLQGIGGDVYDVTAPAQPTFTAANMSTGVDVDADGHQNVWVQMTWGSVSDTDLDHYEAQLSAASAFDTFVDTRAHPASGSRIERWTGLVGNTDYWGRVRAVDWTGNYSGWASGSITSAKDSTAPDQVTGLVVAGARSLIGLTWDAASAADVSLYEVQRALNDGGAASAYATVACPFTTHWIDQSFTEANIQAACTFWYQVRARDTSGNSGSYSAGGSAALNPFGSDSIAASAIIAGKIAASAIVADHIGSSTIVTDHLAASSVVASKASFANLSSLSACMGTLTAGEIQIGTGTVGVNFTGFRIMSTYLAGYNNDAVQFGVKTADGKAYAAGSIIVLDAAGLGIEISSSPADLRSVRYMVSGSTYSRVSGAYGVSSNILENWVKPITGKDSYINYFSVAPNEVGRTATAIIGAYIAGTAITSNVTMAALESGSGATMQLNATEARLIGNKFFINESANAKQTIGLTINQGANDDEILALKSSDVGHGATAFTETDTFFLIQKSETYGGPVVRGFKDPTSVNNHTGIALQGYIGENVDTTKTTAGLGLVLIGGYQTSGSAADNTVADGNVVVFRTVRGGSEVTIAIIDEDGDLYYDGSASAYDSEDDVALLRELSDVLGRERGQVSMLEQPRTAALGIIHPDEQGVMMSTKRHGALLRGAILQLEERIRRLEGTR